jgi:chorismate mutase
LRIFIITAPNPRLPLAALKRAENSRLILQIQGARPAVSLLFFFFFQEACMFLRGIRGATTVESDQPFQIIASTKELLEAMVNSNPNLKTEDMASVFFTTTDDIQSVHPALAARQLGWVHVPMMCAREIPVPGSLPLCIRVLIHWNTDLDQRNIHLRPDLSG